MTSNEGKIDSGENSLKINKSKSNDSASNTPNILGENSNIPPSIKPSIMKKSP